MTSLQGNVEMVSEPMPHSQHETVLGVGFSEGRAFRQLIVPALDGSPSMKELGETGMPKADEATIALRGLMARLQASKYRLNFEMGVLAYSDKVDLLLPLTEIGSIDSLSNFNPIRPTGGTAIGTALETGFQMVEPLLRNPGELPTSAVLLLMTDGQNNAGSDPVQVADRIKSSGLNVKICAAGYGKGADIDEKTLMRLVSSPMDYARCYDPEQLRKFMIASATTNNG